MTIFKSHKGFTLIEVLIVIAIIAILAVSFFMMSRTQIIKAKDARVKSDLSRLKIAFEDYYGDKNCYPPAEWFDDSSDCGTNVLSPYLGSISCDKSTGEPYILETDPTGCKWYRLYGNIQNQQDENYRNYFSNSVVVGTYAVSSANAPASSSTQYDTTSHTYYWCQGASNCTSFNPNLNTCTPMFTDDPNCGGGCSSAGTCASN